MLGVLALPVLVSVYVELIHKRLSTAAPAIAVSALLAGSLAAAAITDRPATATDPGTDQSLAPPELRHAPATVAAAADAGARFDGADRIAAGPVIVLDAWTTPGAGFAPDPLIEAGTATEAPDAPAVVRFRPRSGQTGISRLAELSVRFTVPMDRTSTQPAFGARIGGRPVAGSYRWAESDTVLVLTPATALPYGARVTLSVTAAARSADGIALPAAVSVAFSVLARPAPSTVPAAPSAAPPPSTSGWRWPLSGPITQYFGQTLTKYGVHQGIDIDGQTGDSVRAARAGVVVVAGHHDLCGGLEVHIDHGGGLVSWYRHLSAIGVTVGQHVTAGTIIGRVGATGCALGSHLHFGIRLGSTFVDPLRYLPKR